MTAIYDPIKEATTRVVADQTIAVDAEGFMVDPQAWNDDVAVALAAEIGIELTPQHWQVIRFTRQEFTANGGVTTKELYELFPKKPAKKVAYIAGLHKPSGCI